MNLKGHFLPIFTCFLIILLSQIYNALTTITISKQIYLPQPIDHFGYGMASVGIFHQRLVLDDTHWRGPNTNAPILVYFGGQAPIEHWLDEIGIVDLLSPRHQALVVYIEHRFYGQSIPLRSIDDALSSIDIMSCLNTEQALADFAEAILHVKRNITKTDSPTIVFGDSYSGMLAAWFRLKYPHITIGALASSAPIFNFEELPPRSQYCHIVAQDFQDISSKCTKNIYDSWKIIDDHASQRDGIQYLSKVFKTCSPLHSAKELKDHLIGVYDFVAQYNGRFGLRIRTLCDEIEKADQNSDILEAISRAIINFIEFPKCIDVTESPSSLQFVFDPSAVKAREWQLCSELVTPTSCSINSMFQPQSFDMKSYMNDCQSRYELFPHQHWITTYYGGQDIRTALKNFGSNIIFSNGLKDPLSGAGVLDDISDTIVAITTEQGSHSLDINPAKDDDPSWLKSQRRKEMEIISRWIELASSSNNISSHSTPTNNVKTTTLFCVLFFTLFSLN